VKRVFVATHPTEAHLVQGLLEAEGIAAEVRGESLFAARGEAPLTPETLPSVWVVDDGEADRAAAILAAYGRDDAGPRGRGPTWRCPACRERLEPQFTQCWRCGASRPGGW
jgi:hypothetical protein